MKEIYLDYAATTPLHEEVVKTMQQHFTQDYGNPSSTHLIGQKAAFVLDNAREKVAEFLNCQFSDITFTSGATESNNLLIQGWIKAFKRKNPGIKGHIIVSSIEHPSVLEVAQYLKEQDMVDVDFACVLSDGIVDMNHLFSLVREDTCFISVMYVNNEIGSIQPIRDIGKRIEKLNKTRTIPILFHTDATQAVNYLPVNVAYLHVHALSLSGHKMYGPKGVGVLYLSKNMIIDPIFFGGKQEWGIRSGTINVPLVAGLAKAIEICMDMDQETEINRIASLKNECIATLKKNIPTLVINGDQAHTLCSHIHMSFPGVLGENMFLCLDMKGIAVSIGSACAAGKTQDSYVLKAMGLTDKLRQSSIRLTLGRYTTQDEIQVVAQEISNCYLSFTS